MSNHGFRPAMIALFPSPFLRTALAVLTLAALSACASYKSELVPSDFSIHGVDVSKYQGEIDWESARAGGVAFAFIKATEGGDHKDEAFERNWEGARRAGVPRGAYHFVYWCRPALEQVEWFKGTVPQDEDALPPVLDVEWNGHSRTCPKKVPRVQALEEMRIILEAMERHYGKRPIIYTTVDFFADVLGEEFIDHPIWVRSVKGHPTRRYGDRRWTLWQYTAEGRVPGIRGNVDRNTFYGSHDEWRSFLATHCEPRDIRRLTSLGLCGK